MGEVTREVAEARLRVWRERDAAGSTELTRLLVVAWENYFRLLDEREAELKAMASGNVNLKSEVTD